MLLKLYRDDQGAILTSELVLVTTVLLLGSIAGLNELKTAMLSELSGLSRAFGSLDQSYEFHGFRGGSARASEGSFVRGSHFADRPARDDDGTPDLVCGSFFANGPVDE